MARQAPDDESAHRLSPWRLLPECGCACRFDHGLELAPAPILRCAVGDADLIVVGAGGAGLCAALTAADGGARVVILEKADKVGGTTAVAGGAAWIPMNDHMADVGVHDTRSDALAYMTAV